MNNKNQIEKIMLDDKINIMLKLNILEIESEMSESEEWKTIKI